MTTALSCAIAFGSGFAYEASCVFWVRNSATSPVRTAGWSMVVAACEVAGIGESMRSPVAAAFFVLGYGVGSFFGVAWGNREKG